MKSAPELDPRSRRGLIAMFALLAGSLALSLAFDQLSSGPGDCVAGQGGVAVDLNVLECVNDVFGTELG